MIFADCTKSNVLVWRNVGGVCRDGIEKITNMAETVEIVSCQSIKRIIKK